MSKDAHRPALAEHEVVESPRKFPGQIKDIYSVSYSSSPEFNEELEDTEGEGEDADDETGDDDRSWTPEGLHVVSQTLRRLDNGFLFVDVVLGWDPLPGVPEYRIRVSGSADG